MGRSYIKYFTGAFHGLEAEILQRFLENVVEPVHIESLAAKCKVLRSTSGGYRVIFKVHLYKCGVFSH